MITHIQHADDKQLQTLLFGDETSDEISSISSHVEACVACQSRLRQLAASDAEEAETHSLLSGGGVANDQPASKGSNAGRHGDNGIDHAREYLGPPSHPEMLGRLGRYEIEREIGSGGMGVVFKGFDNELNRPVAIKVLARHLARSGAARQRFGRESRAAAAVVHEHVVAIHNVESDGETPFLVMQFVAGESLQARVDRVGPLSVAEVLRIGIQTAAGLAAAHEQGIVHRDIKPANILLEHGVERVLLTDFGLARTVDDASLTQTGIIAGTPHYMSPEQANGAATDPRTDLFSLGSVLYFVATGHPPFRAERAMAILHRICHDQQRPAWQVNEAIPDELSDLIDRLLEKRPTRRFASATAVREALVRLLHSVQQRRPSLRSRVRSWTRRNSRWVATGLASLAVLAVVAAFLLQPPRDDEQQVAPAPEVTKQSTSLSTELLTEVAASEPTKFANQLQQIAEQLRALESVQHSEFSRPMSDDWQQETQAIHLRLDRLQTMTIESPHLFKGESP